MCINIWMCARVCLGVYVWVCVCVCVCVWRCWLFKKKVPGRNFSILFQQRSFVLPVRFGNHRLRAVVRGCRTRFGELLTGWAQDGGILSGLFCGVSVVNSNRFTGFYFRRVAEWHFIFVSHDRFRYANEPFEFDSLRWKFNEKNTIIYRDWNRNFVKTAKSYISVCLFVRFLLLKTSICLSFSESNFNRLNLHRISQQFNYRTA